ncbi:hypothetical protein [Mycobacteroides abscessus]|uniref:hypothetical protein n=1 Tax=Mycobacteroides abscessus TaxID=36809 RepID=UPI000D3E93A5|nr:hypothetical protein [Mycobacteroides abscessus]PVA36490.1 hypothetical protein DDJ88_11795 [Mycobacteroides abscessus]PVA43953.1 hypothetical protein DDJ35_20625 [Mycobacteroides abscessus]RIQ90766.1 hypothetical protein D2E34_12250 [Mycobacteroides abscessus]RIQ98906.1 hypothetical protein D2E30_09615 [Mycobacteroides abscessus]
MSTIDRIVHRPITSVIESIERGLDRMMTDPTERLRQTRRELEREQMARHLRSEVRYREARETLDLAATYLRGLPKS